MTIRDIAIAFSYELDKGSESQIESSVDNLKSKTTKAAKSTKESIKEVGKGVKEVGKSANESLQTLKTIAKTALSIAALKSAFNFLKEYSEDAQELSKKVLDIRDSFGKWLAKTDEQLQLSKTLTRIIERLWRIVERGLNKITDLIDDLSEALGGTDEALKIIGVTVGSIFLALNLNTIIKGLTVIRALLSGILLKVLPIAAAIMLAYLAVEDFIFFMEGKGSVLGDIFEEAGVNADEFRTKAKKAISDIRKYFGEVFSTIGETVSTAFSDAVTFIGDHSEEISQYLVSLGHMLETVFQGIPELLDGLITPISEVFQALTDTDSGAEAFTVVMEKLTEFNNFIADHGEQVKAAMKGIGVAIGLILLYVNPVFRVIVIITMVVTVVRKLYKAFQQLRTNAAPAIEGLKAKFENFKKTVVKGVEKVATVLDKILHPVQTLRTAFGPLASTAKAKFNSIKTSVQSGMNAAKTAVVSKAKAMLSSIKSNFANMVSAVKAKMNAVKTAIVNGLNNALSAIKSMGAKAFQWGSDIVSNIANGIKAGISKVISAASSIADAIRRLLHFSVPDEGPLADFDTYMPDMMDLMSKGIKKNKYKVIAEVEGVAKGMTALRRVNANGVVTRSFYNSTASSRSVVQNLTFNQQFNGERAIQEKSAKAAKSNSRDITGQLARALAYT